MHIPRKMCLKFRNPKFNKIKMYTLNKIIEK